MDDNVLKEIRKAEEKAKNIMEDVKKKSEIIARNSSEEARKKEASEIEAYSKEMEKKFAKESETVRKEAEAIIDKGRSNASRLTQRSESNSSEAIYFLMKKFKETLG